jgi:hypothetical protein
MDEHVYQHQFHREGVISAIIKLSEGSLSGDQENMDSSVIILILIISASSSLSDIGAARWICGRTYMCGIG